MKRQIEKIWHTLMPNLEPHRFSVFTKIFLFTRRQLYFQLKALTIDFGTDPDPRIRFVK